MDGDNIPSKPHSDEEWDYLCTRRTSLKLRVLTNRLYQQERQRILERREGIVKAASLVAGSVALSRLVGQGVINACLLVIFCGTASSLVFGWGNKACDGAKRASAWIMVDRDIDAAGERRFDEKQLDAWAARCHEIEADEPAPNEVLLERCQRRAAETLGTTTTPGGPRFLWRLWLLLP